MNNNNKIRLGILLALLFALSIIFTLAQPTKPAQAQVTGNDDFDTAVFATFGTYETYTGTQNTTTASTAVDDPSFACVSGQKSQTVWYRYSATADGYLDVDTQGSAYDTVIAVWTGTRGSLTSQGCHNDVSGSDLTSQLLVPVTSGQTYYIEIASNSGSGGNLTVHVSHHIFFDVPVVGKEWMEPWVGIFFGEGITTGCGINPLRYCPENSVTRAAMAVFVLRTLFGPSYVPAPAGSYFEDLPVAGKEWMEPWVDDFYERGFTTGCAVSPLRYCPESPVTRAGMAVIVLRAVEGKDYIPDPTGTYFSDVPVAGKEWMEPWVDEFYERGITTGCAVGPLRFCPENPVTRASMAVFLNRAFDTIPDPAP